jgi:hypothetical protein
MGSGFVITSDIGVVECYLVEGGCAMRALEDIACNKPSNSLLQPICFVARNRFATFQAIAESYINVAS